MSKSILVIDTPKSCADCPCCFADNVMVWCGKEKDTLCEPGETPEGIETFKPDWCPLKKLTKKKEEKQYLTRTNSRGSIETYGETKDAVAVGWNMCIDEILKGANENEQKTSL